MIEIVDPQTGELMDTDSVPGLAGVAALHDDQIYRLSALVAQLDEASEDPSSATAGPFTWHTLSPDAAETLWRDLAEWVGWLRGRYPLARRIPLCWWRHPELIEELTALWLAWRDAYVEKGAPLTGPADWHGRFLPEFLRRVGAGGWNIACENEHKENVTSLYDVRRVDDDAAFEDFVAQDMDDRGGAAPTTVEPKEITGMDDNTMQNALAAGEARILGELPDSPVAYQDAYWVPCDEGWVRVEDQDTTAFLVDAERRLRLADEAVARAEQL